MINFDLSNPADWELVATIQRDFAVDSRNVIIPIELTARILLVIATSVDALPTWRYGGSFCQFGRSHLAFNPYTKLVSTESDVMLNEPTTLLYTDCNYSYFLGYLAPKWFKNCYLQIFQFIGEIQE